MLRAGAVLAVLLCCADAAALETHFGALRIRRNHTVGEELQGAGLDPAAAEGALHALRAHVDFRRAQPGDALLWRTDVDGRLLEVEYRRNFAEAFRATLDPAQGAYAVAPVGVPMETRIERVEITIETSVWDAFIAAGEDPGMAVALADVFAWDVDFYQDPRKGDHASLVLEKTTARGRTVRWGEPLAASYDGGVGRKRAFLFDGSYYDHDGRSTRRAFLKSPLKYAHITSRFGSRFHPVLKYTRAHQGVDYGTPTGTPVWAVADGAVTFAGTKGGYGRTVTVRHANGFTSLYAHLSRLGEGVAAGKRVAQKQVIGYTGTSGLSTGPHLHFGLLRGPQYVNPLNQRFPPGRPVPQERLELFKAAIAPMLALLDPDPA
jgi:murein DD-endopeptidase MepM/ murein hydrolase activator NlpD